MKSYAQGRSWTLELAPEWEVTQDPECVTITRSDEGALQISSAEKATGRIVDEDLLEFVDDPSWGTPMPVEFGMYRGHGVSYDEDGDECRRYWVANGNRLLFITYFGSPEATKAEEQDVNKMLSSLRVRG
jgi:hypothetical protein